MLKMAFRLLSAFLVVDSNSSKPLTNPLPVEAALDLNSLDDLGGASFSPDGQLVSYAIRRSSRDVPPHSVISRRCVSRIYSEHVADVVVTNITTLETKIVAGGGSYNTLPVWSPDGRYVAFASNREGDGDLKLWIWEAKTGNLRKISDSALFPKQMQWASNGHTIITTAWHEAPGGGKETPCPIDTGAGRKIPAGSVSVYKSEPTLQGKQALTSDPWSLDGVYGRDLVSFDVASGHEQMLDDRGRLITLAVSPDGSRVAFIASKRFERVGSQQILYDLNTMVLATGQKSTVARDIRLSLSAASFTWSPDSSLLAYQTGGQLEEKNDCYVVAALGGEVRNITAFPRSDPGRQPSSRPVWNPLGQIIYLVRDDAVWKVPVQGGQISRLGSIPGHRIARLISLDDGTLWSTDRGRTATVVTNDLETGQDGFYRIDLTTGQSNVLLENGRHYWDFFAEQYLKVAPNGRAFLYPAQDLEHPSELWIADVDVSHALQLTHVNPVLDRYAMGPKKVITWMSLDGEMLSGFLILPPGFKEREKYPVVVSVYGGRASNSNMFCFPNNAVVNMQLFATRGYVVFAPGAPQRLGTPMFDLAKTVLPGVNKVIEMGIGDPKRIGVIGQSYGGYSVLSLLVQTPRFGAAVMSAGFGDLISAYGEMDENGSTFQTSILETGQGLIGGTPWEYRDRYVENSPIFHLDRIQTPLLIAHGGADTSVPSFLAEEVFVGMRRLGKEAVYAKYLGENHSPLYWSYPSQLDFCNRVISWFDTHLK